MVGEGNNDCMYYAGNFKRLGLYGINWKIRQVGPLTDNHRGMSIYYKAGSNDSTAVVRIIDVVRERERIQQPICFSPCI